MSSYGYVETPNKLDCSMDSESTASTEIESTFSRDSSFSYLQSPPALTPRRVRYIFFRRSSDSDYDSDFTSASPKPTRKSMPRTNSGRYIFVFLALILCLAPTKIIESKESYERRVEWRRLVRGFPKLQESILSSKQDQKGFTVVLRGSRVDLLRQSLDTLSSCSPVEEVQIDYQKSEEVPELLLSHLSGKANVLGDTTTDGVMLLEEGIMLNCNQVTRGKWRMKPKIILVR